MERAHQTTRRPKWHAPPPKIPHFPRRPRKKAISPEKTASQSENKERQEQERVLFRERSREKNREGAVEEETWKFQTEMLRAECGLLRMAREAAVRKMERRKLQLDRTLTSTLHILISVRRKISEGKDASLMVEEEISRLMEKLRVNESLGAKTKRCNNFDKQVSYIKNQEEARVMEIREMAEQSFCAKDNSQVDWNCNSNVIMFNNWKCSGHCKTIVQKIVEQVRVETEQWSQMQAMLGQVRDEMDELQTSRDFWEDRALDADYEIQSLHLVVKEWRQKAQCSKVKVNELQEQISKLQEEMKRVKKGKDREPSTGKSQAREVQNEAEKRVVMCQLKENGRENYGCRFAALGDFKRVDSKRQPLADIGNLSSLMRQYSRVGLRM